MIEKYNIQEQETIKIWFNTQCDNKSRLNILRKKGIEMSLEQYNQIKYELFLSNKKLGIYDNWVDRWK